MKIIFAAILCKYSLTFPVHVIFPCSHIHPKWCSLSCITQPFPHFLLLATILYENTDRQGGITCEAIDEPRKSLKAIDKHVIINFCDKNVVIARLRDKNAVFIYLFIYAVSDLMHNWVPQRPEFKSALRVVKMSLKTIWVSFCRAGKMAV